MFVDREKGCMCVCVCVFVGSREKKSSSEKVAYNNT
jgi:hypothetical protein